MPKTFTYLKIIFFTAGLGLLVTGIFLTRNTFVFKGEALEAQGEVIELIEKKDEEGSTYSPRIKFATLENEEVIFTSTFSSNPPSFFKGERVDVLYDPSQPEKAKINGFFSIWLSSLIPGLSGLVLILIAIFLIIKKKHRESQKKDLLSSGRLVQADFQAVEQNTSFQINGRYPYRIMAQHEENGQVHIFHSDNIWFDPKKYISEKKRINIYVDPRNINRYYMDISFLPELAK